jgi:Domain of unknown function (DUF4249)
MMNQKHFGGVVALLIGLAACVPKPIPLELEAAESLPVVWTQAIPGSGAVVYFAKSFTALSYQDGDTTDATSLLNQLLVSDGLVVISHQGIPDTLDAISNGVYASLSLPIVPGDEYFLTAIDRQTGKSVTSLTTAFGAVEIDSIGYEKLSNDRTIVRVYFNDPDGENNYAFHYYSRYANILEVEDPLAANNTVVTKLVTDIAFQSNQAIFEAELEALDSDTLYVSLNNIGDEYFDYLGQRQRGGNIYNQLVQEPITYISNITDGYGMFSLHLPSVRMIVMED